MRLAGARRGLLRSAQVLAAAALLALTGALALPATAEAQTTTTFVSNIGEKEGRSGASIQAQSFTTGSNTSGYTLSEVLFRLRSGSDLFRTYIKVKRDASGAPGDLVANLSNPENFADNSTVGFTAPASTTLAAGTVYWVVVNEGIASPANRISVRATSSHDQAATTTDPNWLIADRRLWKNNDGSAWYSSPDVLMLAINGTAAVTPGICDRTQQVHEAIVGALSGVDNCAAVTVADLAGITTLDMSGADIASLKSGDFTGLTSVTFLNLASNRFTTLPAGVFSGLTALTRLWLFNNSLNKLPAGVLAGLSSLTDLRLQGNDRTLPLIVSLEKVGADRVRAVAPAGAPFALPLPVVVANGSLAGGATTLAIAAGEVATDAVTVIPDPGTTAEVTVDLGTPLPQLPSDHQGYAITRAATGLPVTTRAGTTCTRNPGDLWCGVVTVEPVASGGLTNGHGYSHAVSAGRAATDADDDPITWSKTGGADTDRFALTTAGVLTFVAAPDYESPADVASADPANAAANNEYVVFVTASDGTADTELKLVVQVTNVDEGQSGTVSIDDTAPMVGDELTASTADEDDPDGLPDPFAPTWQWYYTTRYSGEFVISGATSATYTVVEADLGAALIAKASWTDVGAFANTLARAPTPVCDRTDQVRDEIVYQAGVSACGGVTDAHLTAITSLYFNSAGITSLKAGDFSGLTALQELALDGNQLSSLPARVFSGLTALETLYLQENQLSSLPARVFSGLTALRELDLDSNQLGLLPASVFSGLTALETLYLHYNQLSSLPAGVFSGLTALETLYLHYNQLSSLPAGVFSGLTALQELALDGNPVDPLPVAVSLEQAGRGGFKAVAPTAAPFALTLPVSVVNGEIDGETTLTIPAGMVQSASVTVTRSAGSTSAVTADIGTLPELPSNHFGYALEKSSGLPLEVFAAESGAPTPVCDRTEQVRDEIVYQAEVSACGGVSDAHLAAITSLDFNFAGITSLKEGDFSGLTSLQELYLNGNDLSLLPAGVFSGLTSLERLDLQENQLSSLPAGVFSGLTSLRELDLESNQLSLLPASVFSGLTSLETLDLQENQLGSLLAGVFSGLTALETLYLNDNQLSSLLAGVFSGLTSLETLYLDGNPVDPLPVGVSLETEGRGGFKAVALTAAPFALTLPVSVVNGEIVGETTLTIPAGMVSSASVSVTRSAGSTSAVTADIGTLPELPSNHQGYALEKSSGLPLEVFAAESGAPTPVCDRTEQVRDEIVYQAGVSTCGGVTDADLAGITFLGLSFAEITLLKEGDFSGLTSLQELHLNGNELSSLAAGVFSGLTSLERLDLQENQLSLLPAGVFSGLTSLRELDLDSNQLSSLAASVFSGLTSLQELNLSGNALSSLDAGVFSGLTSLQELNLYDNALSSLPAGVFSGLTSLETLYLDGNPVDPLPVAVSLEPAEPGQFKAVAPTAAPFALTLPVSVVNGVIDGGATTLTIPAGMVQSDLVSVTRIAGLTSAVTADIGTLPELPSNHQGYALEKSSGLPLEVFPAELGAPETVCDRTEQVRDEIVAQVSGVSTCGGVTDAHLAAITFLGLSVAEITSLKEGDFSGLTALEELDLGDNELSLLPAGAFSGLTALTTLDLNGNALSSLDAGAFSGLTALTTLDLNGNALSSLDAGVLSGLTALTTLNLNDNALSSLDAGAFSGLTALEVLQLESNDLSLLPAGVFSGLTSLQELYLYANELSSLPAGVFSGLTALARLELDGNAVDPLPVTVSLEPAGRGRFNAVAPTAAPFALTLPVSVVNGEIDGETTLTIPAGMVQSASVTVTRSVGSTSAVTADIGTLPELPSGHRGYALEKSSGLPLEVFPAESGAPTPVCDRTEQVRDEIVAACRGEHLRRGDGRASGGDHA